MSKILELTEQEINELEKTYMSQFAPFTDTFYFTLSAIYRRIDNTNFFAIYYTLSESFFLLPECVIDYYRELISKIDDHINPQRVKMNTTFVN